MATLVASRDVPARRPRRVPWSRRAWSEAFYLAAGIPAQAAGLLIPYLVVRKVVPSQSWTAPEQFLAWLVGLVALFLLVPVLTGIHRHRLRVTGGVENPGCS